MTYVEAGAVCSPLTTELKRLDQMWVENDKLNANGLIGMTNLHLQALNSFLCHVTISVEGVPPCWNGCRWS